MPISAGQSLGQIRSLLGLGGTEQQKTGLSDELSKILNKGRTEPQPVSEKSAIIEKLFPDLGQPAPFDPTKYKDPAELEEALKRQFQGENIPRAYGSDIFRSAFRDILGQKGKLNETVVLTGTRELAQAYVNEYAEATGKLPTEQQISEFVDTNLTPQFASDFITGQFRPGVMAQRARSEVERQVSAEEEKGAGARAEAEAASTLEKTKGIIEPLYAQQRAGILDAINKLYGQKRGRIVEEEAVLGRLRSPASIVPLSQLEQQRGEETQQALSQLAGGRAGGYLDLSKFLQNLGVQQQELGLRKRGLLESQRQFDISSSLAQQEQAYQRGLDRQRLEMASDIGRQQAEAEEPGTFDYLSLGLQGLGLALTPISPAAGVGTTLLGGGLGLFKKKKKTAGT